MSIGESDGGLPPDNMVEMEPKNLEDCIRVIDRFHDPKDGAMTRVVVAPCSPFSASTDLMKDGALGPIMALHPAELILEFCGELGLAFLQGTLSSHRNLESRLYQRCLGILIS